MLTLDELYIVIGSFDDFKTILQMLEQRFEEVRSYHDGQSSSEVTHCQLALGTHSGKAAKVGYPGSTPSVHFGLSVAVTAHVTPTSHRHIHPAPHVTAKGTYRER